MQYAAIAAMALAFLGTWKAVATAFRSLDDKASTHNVSALWDTVNKQGTSIFGLDKESAKLAALIEHFGLKTAPGPDGAVHAYQPRWEDGIIRHSEFREVQEDLGLILRHLGLSRQKAFTEEQPPSCAMGATAEKCPPPSPGRR